MGSSTSIESIKSVKCDGPICEIKIEPFNINDYNIIIGSGGFGIIIKNSINNTVIKLLYNSKVCSQSKYEFDIHKMIFLDMCKYKKINCDKIEYVNQIYTSTPIDFQDYKIIKNDNVYTCGYRMTLIHSLPIINKISNVLYHIILKSEYQPMIDKIIGKEYLEPVSDKNPARGFFASSDYIENKILSSLDQEIKRNINNINDIAFRMGFLFSFLIFVCEYNPMDVEYVLCLNNNKELSVGILDFGMVSRIEFNISTLSKKLLEEKLDIIATNIISIHDTDLYFPYYNDKGFKSFIDGTKYGFDYSILNMKNTEDKNILNNKTYVYNKYIDSITKEI